MYKIIYKPSNSYENIIVQIVTFMYFQTFQFWQMLNYTTFLIVTWITKYKNSDTEWLKTKLVFKLNLHFNIFGYRFRIDKEVQIKFSNFRLPVRVANSISIISVVKI